MFGAACVPAPLTPARPIALRSALPPRDVVQVATRQLSGDGYEIVVSDVGAGTVTARRKASPQSLGAEVQCVGAESSMLHRMGETTISVTVSARASGDSSDVQIATRALTSSSKMPGMFANKADSETDCVSSGAVEKRLEAAIGATVP